MILMMRSHRHGGPAHGVDDRPAHLEREHWSESMSTAQLRRQCDALASEQFVLSPQDERLPLFQVDDGIEGRRGHACFVRPADFAELIGRAMSFGVGARLPW
jgi:hypothetical protein